ncbi:MAG: hypothetical protein WCY53_04870 [Sphaerochaetaceae bacterium]
MKNIAIGVLIGFIPMLTILIIQLVKKSKQAKEHKQEIARLKAMLTDRMDLESEGLGKLKGELDELKAKNENLRISLQSYSQKPNRKELARLQVYQQAVDRLIINSPGFGAAWQAALKESEQEFEKTFFGLHPFIKKVIPLKESNATLLTQNHQIDD